MVFCGIPIFFKILKWNLQIINAVTSGSRVLERSGLDSTLQDMMKTATNTMINIMVVRRGETLSNSSISEEEREVLQHAPPKDNQKQLFNGKLVEFGELRTSAGHNKVLVDLAQRPQQRPLLPKSSFTQHTFLSLKK